MAIRRYVSTSSSTMIRVTRRQGVVILHNKRTCTSSCTSWDYDILVAGGGIVGAAFVSEVLNNTSKDRLKIGIVDVRAPPSLSSCTERLVPDLRVYALSPQSIELLRKNHAWKHIEGRSQPYTHMQVWESDGPGVVRFAASDMQTSELGRICEDSTIQAAVYQALVDQGHSVDLIFGAAITGLTVPSIGPHSYGPAEVTISPVTAASANKETGGAAVRKVTARLVVGADGAQSAVRRLAGLSQWGWGYGQEAVVCTVKLAGTGGDATAWQKYLSRPTVGPLALLPLWGGHASVVWSCAVPHAKWLCSLSNAAFADELNAALQAPVANDRWSPLHIAPPTPTAPFPLPAMLSDALAALGAVATNGVGGITPLPVPAQAAREFLQGAVAAVKRPLHGLRTEAASLVDTAMSAVLLRDPLRLPPKVAEVVSARVTFPLQFQQAKQYHRPRVVLAGDAAHSIHPQAGQGLNLGLADAHALALGVVAALAAGRDVGHEEVLSEYGRRRYMANLAMMGAVDAVHRVFTSFPAPHSSGSYAGDGEATRAGAGAGAGERLGSEGAARGGVVGRMAGLARSVGMLGVQGLGPLKGRIARLAMGDG